ncbi:hypothetical protein [Streptomyces sp. NPDC002346]
MRRVRAGSGRAEDGLAFTPHPGGWFSVYVEPAAPRAFTRPYKDPGLQRAPAGLWRVVTEKMQDRAATNNHSVQGATVRRALDAPRRARARPCSSAGRGMPCGCGSPAGSVSAAGERNPPPTRTKRQLPP